MGRQLTNAEGVPADGVEEALADGLLAALETFTIILGAAT